MATTKGRQPLVLRPSINYDEIRISLLAQRVPQRIRDKETREYILRQINNVTARNAYIQARLLCQGPGEQEEKYDKAKTNCQG